MIKLYLRREVADNFETVAKVSKVRGPGIGTISVTNTKLNNIEFYPADERGRFVGVHTTPIGLQNGDKVYVSGIDNYKFSYWVVKLIILEYLQLS